MTDTYEDIGAEFLEHYGIPGMKWGRRRSDAQLAKSRKGKKSKDGDGEPEKKVVGKTKTSGKKASEMSDKQLQSVINRMNMEQNYARMTAPPPTRTKRLMQTTSKIVADSATSIARTQLTKAGNDAVTSFIGASMAKKAAGKKAAKATTDAFGKVPSTKTAQTVTSQLGDVLNGKRPKRG